MRLKHKVCEISGPIKSRARFFFCRVRAPRCSLRICGSKSDDKTTLMIRLFWAIGGGVLLAAVAVYAWFQFSPWPMVLYSRLGAYRQGFAKPHMLERYVPAGVVEQLNLQYEAGDPDAKLDVFYPATIEETEQLLPTIVWVHGGSWITGSKDGIANYLKIVAARGFTTVGVNYTLAPEKTYPNPVRQVNEVLAYIGETATRLHVDSSKLFLAGDSAGSQIAAQLANVISVPSYAREVGIVPSIERSQLRGVILHCGVYDAELTHNFRRRGVLWAYFGTQDFMKDPRIKQFSVVRYITADFPPIFISSGNDDFLAPQSHLFAEVAAGHGVIVDSLLFPQTYQPRVPHEFQFDLDTDEGRLALERTVKFMVDRLR
jgi:acetyl esterase